MDETILVWSFIVGVMTAILSVIILAIYTLKKLKYCASGLDLIRLEQDIADNKFTQTIDSLTYMGKKITSLESAIKGMKEKFRKKEQCQASNFSLGYYHQARKIVELGGNEVDLVQDCGLTRIEAQMIKALQAKNKVP